MDSIHIITSEWDTWIKEEELPSLNDEDIAWFKNEIGLSLDDLQRICAEAREIVREFKHSDELLHLTYDIDEAWYVTVTYNGRWELCFRRSAQHTRAPLPDVH